MLTIELNDLDSELYEMFVPMGEYVASLFTNDDLQIAADILSNGSAAMLILWEDLWVADLHQAIVNTGGKLIERSQISPEAVEEFAQIIEAQ